MGVLFGWWVCFPLYGFLMVITDVVCCDLLDVLLVCVGLGFWWFEFLYGWFMCLVCCVTLLHGCLGFV